jgi:hypothetical protein
MAKEVIVNVKITADQARKNIEELNKSLNASESLIDELEDECESKDKQRNRKD